MPRDLKQFNLDDYDMVCLFSPIGVRSLLKNFPKIKETNILIAAFGASTHSALKAAGLKLTIAAPTKTSPSMAMAIENFINGKTQDEVITARPSTLKKDNHNPKSFSQNATKKPKSVFANKAKYKQLQEERKAQAAARRAERKAEREAAAQAKAAALAAAQAGNAANVGDK